MQIWHKSEHEMINLFFSAPLVKHFSQGKRFLRRFYYGSDYGKSDKSNVVTMWSAMILNKARMNNFKIVTKRVKYIRDKNYRTGFVKKCDMDIEMSVDLIEEAKNYDNIILFSGDGDLYYVLKYLKYKYNKKSIIFGSHEHIGKEIYDAKNKNIVDKILYIEDFEYRLNID